MARLLRDGSVLDVWLEENPRGSPAMFVSLDGAPPARRHVARHEYRRLLYERLRGGWLRVLDPRHEQGVDEPIEPALEAALAADPSDAAAALVYADWYQQHEHPRGELIALQHAGSPRADAFLQEWRDYLIPGPSSELELAWRNGFIHRARIGRSLDPDQRLWELARSPSARFLRELVLGDHGLHDPEVIAELLVRGSGAVTFPHLRHLHLGDFDTSRADHVDLAYHKLGDLRGIDARYPRLEVLLLKGRGDVELGVLRFPSVRQLALRTSSLAESTLRSIARTDWPALEELELWSGAARYGAEADADDLARPFERADFAPRLRVLRLMNSEHSDELAARVAFWPCARELEVLDFSLGTLGSDGATALIDAHQRDALPRLRALHVFDCCLAPADLARLREAGLPVDQTPIPYAVWRAPNRGREAGQKLDRFVSVSE